MDLKRVLNEANFKNLKVSGKKKKHTLVQTDIPTTTGWTFIKTGLSEAHFDALSHCVTKKIAAPLSNHQEHKGS